MAAKWKEGYLHASFRGVEFFINGHSFSSGRRQKEHIFPERNNPDYEDLGRQARTFKVSAYVVDEDYYSLRDAFIKALEAPGKGKLVHPYLGIKQAVVFGEFTERETTGEGNVARFDITFKEFLEEEVTVTSDNTQQEILDAKDSMINASKEQFIVQYDIDAAANTAIKDAQSAVSASVDTLSTAKQIANSKAEFQRQLANINGKIVSLTLNGEDLTNALLDPIDFGNNPFDPEFPLSGSEAKEAFSEMLRSISLIGEPVTQTPQELSDQEIYPSKQIQTYFQHVAVASAAGTLSSLQFKTSEEAQDLQDKLFDILDSMAQSEVITNTTYAAIRDIRYAVSEDIDKRIRDLERLVEVKLPETRSSLRVTNDIYGNLDREQEIIDRNNIEHPMFITSSESIQVRISG